MRSTYARDNSFNPLYVTEIVTESDPFLCIPIGEAFIIVSQSLDQDINAIRSNGISIVKFYEKCSF